MLLPSALPCDFNRDFDPLHHHNHHGIVSPPASPPNPSSSPPPPPLFALAASSCFSLQNLVAATSTSTTTTTTTTHGLDCLPTAAAGSLPHPVPWTPTAPAPSSPMKRRRLRLRTPPPPPPPSRPTLRDEELLQPRRGIVQRTGHKRARSSSSACPPLSCACSASPPPSSAGSDSVDESVVSSSVDGRADGPDDREAEEPTTPKRARIAPERLPLGLGRADFHGLFDARTADSDAAAEAAEWSVEDDCMLVELVLDKLRLSKSDWQDCARNLGRDRRSLSRRWKSLVLNDEVGLKRRKLHSTWR